MADVPSVPAVTEYQNKLNAALRYGATSAASLFTVLGVFSILSADDIVQLKAQIDILSQSVLTAYGALTKMWVIAGPAAVILLTKVGMNSSTVKAMIGKVIGIAGNAADPKMTEAKVAIVVAAASPSVSGDKGGVVVTSELAANPDTPANVVSSPRELPK